MAHLEQKPLKGNNKCLLRSTWRYNTPVCTCLHTAAYKFEIFSDTYYHVNTNKTTCGKKVEFNLHQPTIIFIHRSLLDRMFKYSLVSTGSQCHMGMVIIAQLTAIFFHTHPSQYLYLLMPATQRLDL